MNTSFRLFCSFLVVLPVHVSAQNSSSKVSETCTEIDASSAIHILSCTEQLQNEALAEIGRNTCGDNVVCGVWFWMDDATAPSTAPDNHDGLTAEQVQSAMAVYAADQDTLIRIDRN